MMHFVNYFTLYLPAGWSVSEFPVSLTVTAESIVYDMTLFTVEHKRLRIRHNLLYVKM